MVSAVETAELTMQQRRQSDQDTPIGLCRMVTNSPGAASTAREAAVAGAKPSKSADRLLLIVSQFAGSFIGVLSLDYIDRCDVAVDFEMTAQISIY